MYFNDVSRSLKHYFYSGLPGLSGRAWAFSKVKPGLKLGEGPGQAGLFWARLGPAWAFKPGPAITTYHVLGFRTMAQFSYMIELYALDIAEGLC